MNSQTINLQYTTIKSPLPDFIYEGLREYSNNANSYHPQPQELVKKLADKYSLPAEMVYLTAGIDEAIQIFAKTYGSNAFVFTPSYTVYSDVVEFGGRLTHIQSIIDNNFSIHTDQINGASLIFLANPNNPSGFTTKNRVIELVKNNPDAIVCIDEAYGEFAPELSVIDQVKLYKNLVVFRSFSKDYGMAGNRIGYFMADPEIINVVKNKTQWSNVSYLSVGAAMIALEHKEHFVNMRKDLKIRRDQFMKFLDEHNLKYLPSKINAVLVKFDSETSGTKFVEYLENNNFVISHGNGNSNIGLDKSFARITIGTEDQMNALKKVIENYP